MPSSAELMRKTLIMISLLPRGKLKHICRPEGIGVRVDGYLYPGYTVPPYYDSLIAKLIAHGRDREEAVARMRRALDEFTIEGIKTVIPLHRKIMDDERFLNAEVFTNFLESGFAW